MPSAANRPTPSPPLIGFAQDLGQHALAAFLAGLLAAVLVSGLASRTLSPVAALVLAAAMTVVCYLIFVRGLGVTVPMLGPWIGI